MNRDTTIIIVFMCFRQTYIKSMDKDFVAATIQAIGRCATNIGEVRDTCLNGLVQLLSNRDGKSRASLKIGKYFVVNGIVA